MSKFWYALPHLIHESIDVVQSPFEAKHFLLSHFPEEEQRIDAFCIVSYVHSVKEICAQQQTEKLMHFIKNNASTLEYSLETCQVWMTIYKWDAPELLVLESEEEPISQGIQIGSWTKEPIKPEQISHSPETNTKEPSLDKEVSLPVDPSPKSFTEEVTTFQPEQQLFGVTVPQHTMVYIEPGTFMMGRSSNDFNQSSEIFTRHWVHITRPFWISAYPCAQKLYKRVMNDNPSTYKNPYNPVESISWCEVIHFCNVLSHLEGLEAAYILPSEEYEHREFAKRVRWNQEANGYRLPTEAEWEYVAKAGEDYLYAGSDHLDDVGWYEKNSYNRPHMVGDKQPNAWSMYDITGNVFEWVWDSYERFYTQKTQVDPVYENSTESKRMYRGGAWDSPSFMAKVSYRRTAHADYKSENLGFRLVRGV